MFSPQEIRRYSLVCLVSAALMFQACQPYPESPIEGYASATSVFQGDTIDFHVSTDSPTYDIEVYRTAASPIPYPGTFMTTVSNLPGNRYPIPRKSYQNGCDWPVAYTLEIPPAWQSGIYLAKLITPEGDFCFVPFVVKEDEPGSTSTILFMYTANTHQAYNTYGGKSLYYDVNSAGLPSKIRFLTRSHILSFDRPIALDYGFGSGAYSAWEAPFIAWLESEGYTVEYCSSIDLHQDPGMLDHYKLFLIVGHSEYWTRQMRDHLDQFVENGGNLAIFAANTCWWQIRLEENNRRLVCYKNRDLDPLYGVNDEMVTVNWYDDPLFWPENSLTGLSYRNGGYVNFEGVLPAEEGYGDYQVVNPDHWVFQGTGLTAGDEFGWDETIVGPEVDGALFEMNQGVPVVTGEDGTPLNFTILALSPSVNEDVEDKFATMGLYTRGDATVFNAATIDWSQGLPTNPTVRQITRNVLNRLR